MTSTADITLTTTAHSDIGYGGMGFGECPRWSIAEQTLTVCDQYLGCLHRIKMNGEGEKIATATPLPGGKHAHARGNGRLLDGSYLCAVEGKVLAKAAKDAKDVKKGAKDAKDAKDTEDAKGVKDAKAAKEWLWAATEPLLGGASSPAAKSSSRKRGR